MTFGSGNPPQAGSDPRSDLRSVTYVPRPVGSAYERSVPEDDHESRRESLAETVAHLIEVNTDLRRALETRVVIEQAKGILAERFCLSIGDAFKLLRYSARSSRTTLQALAAEVVCGGRTPEQIDAAIAKPERWRPRVDLDIDPTASPRELPASA